MNNCILTETAVYIAVFVFTSDGYNRNRIHGGLYHERMDKGRAQPQADF